MKAPTILHSKPNMTVSDIADIFEIRTQNFSADALEQFKLPAPQCGNCPNFGRIWACPPFADTELKKYQIKSAKIIAVKFRPLRANLSAKQYTDSVRKIFDPILLNLERRTPNAVALLAGTCICPSAANCPRAKNLPCPTPEKMRPSPEALGYDIPAIARQMGLEILWQKNNTPPEHFTLIYFLSFSKA